MKNLEKEKRENPGNVKREGERDKVKPADAQKKRKKPANRKKKNVRQNSSQNSRKEKVSESKKNSVRDAERTRKRIKRRKKVMIQKIVIAAALVILVCGAGVGIFFNLPSSKLSRKLSAGDKYTESGEYELAQASYEEALQIDPTTVEAYRCLAQNNLSQNDSGAAKEILYTGWETTQDEGLLDYYCTLTLNEVVSEINDKNCSFATVDKCIQILGQDAENSRAIELLGTCYDRIFTGSEEENVFSLFQDENIAADTCQYAAYEQIVRSILALYEQAPSEALKAVLAQYAVVDVEYVYLSVTHLAGYHQLLEDISGVIDDASVRELSACLARALEIENDFSGIFAEFEQGNYESAREFIVGDMYQQIQDSFILGESGYWEGAAAIPINKEQMKIHKTEDGFFFSWLTFDEYENSQGVITVWGSRQLDGGIQRTSISYEPASVNGEYYPHTEYVITYEYSNVLKNDTLVQMNYRLKTQVTTQEGTTTDVIGDWGGEHEWETSY